MKTKLATLLEHMQAGDWTAAIRLANKFPRLGDHKEPITRAWGAIQNPDFYRQIGQNPDDLIDLGISALKERYLS